MEQKNVEEVITGTFENRCRYARSVTLLEREVHSRPTFILDILRGRVKC